MINKPDTESTCVQGMQETVNPSETVVKPPSGSLITPAIAPGMDNNHRFSSKGEVYPRLRKTDLTRIN